MWANNSAAMSRYQAASAQASTLPLFTSPTSATNPAGLATNASAVPAATTSAATSRGATAAQGGLLGLFARSTLFSLLRRPAILRSGPTPTYANQFISSGFPINLLSYLAQNQSAQALQGVNSARLAKVCRRATGARRSGCGGCVGALGGGLGASGQFGCARRGWTRRNEYSAAIGKGVSIGNLTAPPAVVDTVADFTSAGSTCLSGIAASRRVSRGCPCCRH